MKIAFNFLIKLCASMGGIGYIKFAPGTLASIITLTLFYVLNPFAYGIGSVLVPVLLLSWLICIFADKIFEGHDNSKIVIDELAGLLVCFAFIDFDLITLCIGFMLFRILDIAKPWPISFLDRNIKGGFGVLLDDLIAGLISGAIIACLKILLIS
jgi:phosphatidylglycerophosphatase A